jgi:hypothetical protein
MYHIQEVKEESGKIKRKKIKGERIAGAFN